MARLIEGPSPSDEFERLIEAGEIEFHDADISQLEPWGRTIVIQFLRTHKIGWSLGNKKVGNVYCLKLSDKFLQYIDVYPDTHEFMWCTDNHHSGVHPDKALTYLLEKEFPGVSIDIGEMTPEGLQAIKINKKHQ